MSHKRIHLKSQAAIKPYVRRLVFLLVFVGSSFIGFAQDKDKGELQKERDRISQEIALTNKLLKETRDNRNKVEGELSLINRKIHLREDLIKSLNGEISLYNRRIANNRGKIQDLEKELASLKDNYAEMVRFAQRTSRSEDRLMYIFASADFFQSIRRIRYFQQYTRYRQKQAEEILKTQAELNQLNAGLLDVIAEKDQLISKEESNKKELTSDLAEQKTSVSNLQQEEKTLIKKLKQQEKQREELNKEIQRIIEAEIRASKKDNDGVFALTPEAAALSANFEKNKGALPWPVNGYVIYHFGGNQLPGGIDYDNPGVSIGAKVGEPVKAVFDGEVTLVSYIDDKQAVFIKHGKYFTVYSNLESAGVQRGSKVTTGQVIGKAGMNDEGQGQVDFILMKESDNVNPESWLRH